MKKSKEIEKEHYLKIIKEKEPVRPCELGVNRVRYDWLKELELSGKIYQVNAGEKYTLLVLKGHEYKANGRINRELLKNRKKHYFEKAEVEFHKRINKKVIEPFYKQISGILVIRARISFPYSMMGISKKYIPTRGLPVEKEPLFSEFVKNCSNFVDPNPYEEYGKFKERSKEFYQYHKMISEEINAIVANEITGKKLEKMIKNPSSHLRHSSNNDEDASIEHMKDFMDWIEKKLLKLHGRKEKSKESFEEMIKSTFNDTYDKFSSKVEEDGRFYAYYFIYQHQLHCIPAKRLCGKANKKDTIKIEFQEQMDEKIRTIIKKVEQSGTIKNVFDNIDLIKKELNQLQTKILVGLEKYNAFYSIENDFDG